VVLTDSVIANNSDFAVDGTVRSVTLISRVTLDGNTQGGIHLFFANADVAVRDVLVTHPIGVEWDGIYLYETSATSPSTVVVDACNVTKHSRGFYLRSEGDQGGERP